jgi:hypothetical protein
VTPIARAPASPLSSAGRRRPSWLQSKKGLQLNVASLLFHSEFWWEVQVSNLRPLQCE